ncbi:MAG: metallophosphoesterase [Candidatus Obscuribacterales bacterium]
MSEFIVIALLGNAFGLVLFLSWSAVPEKGKKFSFGKLPVSKKASLILLVIWLLCFLYSFAEPFGIEVNRIAFRSDKIAAGTGKLRLVHISDLHCDGIRRTENRIPGIVKSLRPDLILFTGDAANNKPGLPDFRAVMKSLSEIAPVFAVNGNHDSRGGRFFDLYGGTGVAKLNCRGTGLTVRDTSLYICGVDVDNETCLAETLAMVPSEPFSIFLYHYPAGADAAQKNEIDLFLCGHTHGGQVRLPFYGALFTNSSHGKSLEWGLYRQGKTRIHVSKGIGMTGLPIRFLAVPEIALIEISR